MIILILGLFCLFIWWLSYHLDWGWYFLVFLSPMITCFLYLSRFKNVFESFPALLGIYAPLVEFWALVLLLAWLISLFRKVKSAEKIEIKLPFIFWFGLFVLSGLLSLLNIYPTELDNGLRYLFRVIIFFYLAFVVLGVNIVDSKEKLIKSLKVLAYFGLFGAVMGLVSLFTGEWQYIYGFPRATPFALFGWAPFGHQHIYLAETLVITLPIAVYFYLQALTQKQKYFWGISAGLMLFTVLATFSRVGWLTVILELIMWAFLNRQQLDCKRFLPAIKIFFMPVLLAVLYFGHVVLNSSAVKGSTSARWMLTELPLVWLKKNPILGHGVGQFVSMLQEVKIFQVEFGDALDAHGIIQKLIVEQGLFGLLAFGLLVFWIVWTLWQSYKKQDNLENKSLASLALFLTVPAVFFQIFSTQYYTGKLWVPMALALAIYYILKKDYESKIRVQ